MKLSELVERCQGSDPDLMVPGPDGIPVPVVDVDHGITVNLAHHPPRRSRQYVELLPADEDEPCDVCSGYGCPDCREGL